MPTPTELLFTSALGLTPPWQCTGIEFSEAESRLDIGIDFPAGSRFCCPECTRTSLPVHDTVEKQWRHLNFFQHTCYLYARVPRVLCDRCGVHLVDVPWARKGSGFTLLFEALVLAMAEQMPIAAMARQLGEHDTRLWRIVQHYVDQARECADYHDVTTIGIDETSRRRGHQYVTIVADTVNKRVLYATDGRDGTTIGRFADDFQHHGGDPDAIRQICMDMSPAYIQAVREVLPNAMVTFDRFHVMKLANEAVDAVRREAAHDHPQLKGTRYMWLRRLESLTDKQRDRMSTLLDANRKLARAYTYLQDLRLFYEVDPLLAVPFLKRWYHGAVRCSITPLRALAKTIRRHWVGILNYHVSRATAGFLEGINSIIQAAKRKARGYRSTRNLITMIYLIAGKLQLALPT